MNAPDIPSLKDALRREVLARRDALSGEERIAGSIAAGENALRLACFQKENFDPGTVVSAFLPIRSEIDPRPLMARLTDLGARLCLPAMVSKTQIEFREITRETKLVEAAFGTVEPEPGAPVLNPSILLVPLSAFDESGGRLGYGAGFYDRAIERLGGLGIDPLLIGFAFDTQTVESVPMEAHDRRLDCIVTETKIHRVTEKA